MCGRFALYSSPEDLNKYFVLANTIPYKASYNIAPTTNVVTLTSSDEENKLNLQTMHWGFIPSWSKRDKKFPEPINARIETVATSRLFKHAYHHKRCVILANGYYEWRQEDNKKQPYYIYDPEQPLLLMAGIYSNWTSQNEEHIQSCAIITQPANKKIATIHQRMPLILAEDAISPWLNANNQNEYHTHQHLAFHAVSQKMNSPRVNNEQCIVEEKNK